MSPARATARAPDPLPQTRDAAGAALTDQEGGRGPARQRRGWGGGGERGSAAPDLECLRTRARRWPLSRRPCPGGRTRRDAGGGRGAVARALPAVRGWFAASLGSELLPAPPSLAGTARSDVSAAPPPPSPHPNPCGKEGAEARRAGRSARLPGASFPSPRASSLSRGVAAPREPFIRA